MDAWNWSGPYVLRWRSRLPSDPPFDHTELVYEIAYKLSGILVKQGGASYTLDNDFAFPDRDWPIQTPSRSPSRSIRSGSRRAVPGDVTRPERCRRIGVRGQGSPHLHRHGHARGRPRRREPAPARGPAPAASAWRSWSSTSGGARASSALGRFAPLTPPDAIDSAWLSKNLFALSPEEAGALWDEKIGPPEVSAVIARLVSEKKLATEADGKKMTMRLLVPLERLSGYEHDLVKALFFGKHGDRHRRDQGALQVERLRSRLEDQGRA